MLKATHIRNEDNALVTHRTKRFEIGAYEIEYTIQILLSKEKKVTAKSVINLMDENLRFGEAAFNGILDDDDNISDEAKQLARKIFPTFYTTPTTTDEHNRK
jgi:hypothetical protein